MRPPFPPHNQPSADSPATAATTATAQPTAITPEQQQMVQMYQMLYSQAQAFGLAMPPLDFSPAGMMQLMQISMQLQLLSAQLAGQGSPNPQATPQFASQVQANYQPQPQLQPQPQQAPMPVMPTTPNMAPMPPQAVAQPYPYPQGQVQPQVQAQAQAPMPVMPNVAPMPPQPVAQPYLYPQGHRIYELENVDIYENGEHTLRYFPRYDHLITKDIYGAVLRYKTRGNVRNVSGENNITEMEVQFSEKMMELYGDRLVASQFMGLERILLLNSGFFLHASLIKYQEMGIAFTAPSGIGKSTQAKLWEGYRGAEIINGDRAGIRAFTDGRVMAYGSPVSGSSGIVKNREVYLNAIVVLRQAPENRIRKMPAIEAFRALYSETLMNTWDTWYMETMTDLLLEAVRRIPVYLLECRPDEEAVCILEQTLREEVKNGRYK